jgi:chromate reductase, NAD(P)H dehydrogenase (quinone)
MLTTQRVSAIAQQAVSLPSFERTSDARCLSDCTSLRLCDHKAAAKFPAFMSRFFERIIMSTTRNVAVFVGSLRKESLNRKLANALISMAPQSLKLAIVEIGGLPLFNQDHEADPPQAVRDFKQQVKASDAVLFITPEYNRSVPGALKNAIDIASRPYGQSAWDGKPGAVISLSPGAIGGFGANQHLRQSMVFLNVPMMQQPEAYIGGGGNLFDDKGNITNDSTREFMEKFLQAFSTWIERNAAK